MDPITMAAGTAALFAKKLVEETGGQTGKGLSAAAGRLIAWIRRRGAEDPETGAAVTMVQAKPDDPVRVDLLGQVLAARVNGDPALAEELADLLLGDAKRAGDAQVTIGGAHISGGVHGHARVDQAGRDQIQLRLDPEP
jgi:hypothetical protein